MIRIVAFIFMFFMVSGIQAQEKQFVKPNDKNISIKGAFFLDKSSKKVIINRIDEKILKNSETFMRPANVHTQSGVRIAVNTNSKTVTFHFEKRKNAAYRFSVMGIFKDGKLVKKITVNPKKEELPDFTVTNQDGSDWAEWTIVLPPYYGLNFTGITLEKDADIKPCADKKKPVYVAIGNSITHGTGQNAGYETYDYRLAGLQGWELYNVAVGGSKISWPVGEMLKNEKIDIITILWGFNDWNAGFSPDNEIYPRYSKLLKLLAEHHPDAEIYCILPTATKAKAPKKGNYTLDAIRQAEKRAAELMAKGNKNIKIIDGAAISDTTYLRDKVHFTAEGAEKFARNLYKKMNSIN